MTSLSRLLIIIGGIVVVATLLIYLLAVPLSIPNYAFSLISIILSELLLFGGLLMQENATADTDAILFRSGWNTAVVFCGLAEFSFAIFAIFLMPSDIPFLVSIQLAILAFGIVACALLLFFGRRSRTQEDPQMLNVAMNQSRYCRLKETAGKTDNPLLKERILSTADNIRFSDNTSSLPVDSLIDSQIDLLDSSISNRDPQKAEGCIEDIDRLTQQRKEQAAMIRRGGF